MSAASPSDPPRRRRGPRPPASRPPADWAGFRALHAPWLERIPAGAPVYGLPRPLVAVLRRAGRVDGPAARAEADLARLCAASRAVGFLDGSPVECRLLMPGASEPAAGRPARVRDARAVEAGPLGDSDLRLKGYLGRLLTHPGFLDELAAQRGLWEALPPHARPTLPIQSGDAGDATSDGGFPAAFAAFCGRWSLEGVAAWDLPVPLPPRLSADPPDPDPGPAPRGVHVFLPFHLAPGEDLLRRVRRLQEAQAAAAGLAPGPPHYEAFARMLEVLHLERVATARHRPPGRAPGFVGDLVRGVAAALGLKQSSQVDKWRKAISARLRYGDDAWIPSFRGPRPR